MPLGGVFSLTVNFFHVKKKKKKWAYLKCSDTLDTRNYTKKVLLTPRDFFGAFKRLK